MLPPHDFEDELEVRAPRKPTGMYTLTLWLTVVSLSALFLTLFMVSGSIQEMKDPLEIELTQIQATLASTPLPNPDEEALSAQYIEVRELVSAVEPVYDELLTQYIPVPMVMEAVASYDQSVMALTSVTQSGRQFVISGEAADEAAVIAYLDALKRSNRFQSVVVQSMSTRSLPTATPLPGIATPVGVPTAAPIRVVDFTISLEPGVNP